MASLRSVLAAAISRGCRLAVTTQSGSLSNSSKSLLVQQVRPKSSLAGREYLQQIPRIVSAVPACHQTAKVIFDDNKTAEFKYIWLRDNCKCPLCVDVDTRQKLLDTPALDPKIKPKALQINDRGDLVITWQSHGGEEHVSTFTNDWLYRYGQCFMHDTFTAPATLEEDGAWPRPPLTLWNRYIIQKRLPEVEYQEFIESDDALFEWLDMFYKFGFAMLRNVPTDPDQLKEVVGRFAYIKETQYGVTWSVRINPTPGVHLFQTGLGLQLHTDMNYRENSPGMQLLHCLKAEHPDKLGRDPGGQSFFVDGFRVAKWMEDNEPSAYHILTSTPILFSIKNKGQRYGNMVPIIVTDSEGDVTEIHYNNRTMGPLQAPDHVVVPFYHAYKLFSERMRQESQQLTFHLQPGDVVAFNNRRVMHGRGSYDPNKVERHLRGCYVDIDEAFSKYDQMLSQRPPLL
ncbi:gamma-butyrobetaine dioxygenase-like [Amphibalanus amphitrite]|uniref:gamma-butyrobetaine dioxygenase-like n=1 Tax=Amphibalanus amphitrite TaxID=1232801 RepID=UPI001C92ABC1|nr:gamma-butyrobetaine dioxygenase-like [Amphibalanus amphitrite]